MPTRVRKRAENKRRLRNPPLQIVGSETAVRNLTNRLTGLARQYGIKVSSEKSRKLVNRQTVTTANININGKDLEQVLFTN